MMIISYSLNELRFNRLFNHINTIAKHLAIANIGSVNGSPLFNE